MAASMAGRSTILRTLCRTSANSGPRRTPFSVPLRTSNFIPSRTPIFHPLPLRLLRRELSSFQPLHSAIASAYLVSRLPSEASAFSQGRFVNYLSPI
ncbi:hypothetical protein L6164_022081 [Bauhinia variegata]|uniref:Uncharacterized protein n=1 Tax=Bauhinia variegata TaxID=167791 RepID=A0ACB9MDX6_BAUVA|nr:hypothetical protein L6164_022081 [Bauhinia variegata]